ncbi:hypothetical protein [Paraflavitalea speifideaquila]|uniref:hypothetical protein n=1 Tax=Paraflavitalea speifideaquila TaxID=3076558 RepID=UPI0028E41CCD|nr:hypothetical protein [Paraflavitalea speifideiaquila]
MGTWHHYPWCFFDAEPLAQDKIIFIVDSLVTILDYKKRQIIFQQSFSFPLSACPATDTSIAVGLKTGRVTLVSTASGKKIADYQLVNELGGKTINTSLTEVRRAANGDLLVATDFAGLVIIDKNGNITRHTHDPLNTATISANNTYRSFAGKKGRS